jgi:hypothetical protein
LPQHEDVNILDTIVEQKRREFAQFKLNGDWKDAIKMSFQKKRLKKAGRNRKTGG